MTSPPQNSEPHALHTYQPVVRRMPDEVWQEIASFLPEDAKLRLPLLREWVERAGSPGLSGDTELHLHLSRSIMESIRLTGSQVDDLIRKFLTAEATVMDSISNDAASIANKLPTLEESILHLRIATNQAKTDHENIHVRIGEEREEHAEVMRALTATFTDIHRDFYQEKVTPLLDMMLGMPNRLDCIEESIDRQSKIITRYFLTLILTLIFAIVYLWLH